MTTEQVFLGKIHIYPGCSAMHYDDRDASLYPTQAVTPSAPAMADATAITIFKTISHTFFFTIKIQLTGYSSNPSSVSSSFFAGTGFFGTLA